MSSQQKSKETELCCTTVACIALDHPSHVQRKDWTPSPCAGKESERMSDVNLSREKGDLPVCSLTCQSTPWPHGLLQSPWHSLWHLGSTAGSASDTLKSFRARFLASRPPACEPHINSTYLSDDKLCNNVAHRNQK